MSVTLSVGSSCRESCCASLGPVPCSLHRLKATVRKGSLLDSECLFYHPYYTRRRQAAVRQNTPPQVYSTDGLLPTDD